MPELAPCLESEEALLWARSQVDRQHSPLDPLMVGPVAALHRWGVDTASSCQGHIASEVPYPWIEVAASSSDRLELLLSQYPLEGFSVWSGGRCRLLPSLALQAGLDTEQVVWSLMNDPPRYSNALTDGKRRMIMISALHGSQADLLLWAERLLV